MIYTIFVDGACIYDPRLVQDGYMLLDASLDLEASKAGSLTLTIPLNAVGYGTIRKLASTIVIKRDGKTIFSGRCLDEQVRWDNAVTYTCEGCLAYLVDSVQRPFVFPAAEGDPATPAAYLGFLLTRHNAQVPESRQLKIGAVTVTDPNGYISRSDTEYSTTLKLVQEGLLDTPGGYLMPRYEADGIYLDYVSDFDTLANQPVEYALNLLDINTSRPGADICTAILPLGAKPQDSDARLTISSLADETTSDICKAGDIVYSKAAETAYGGRIVKVVTWDDVTQAANLLTKAEAALAAAIQVPATVELSAADLAAAGYDYGSYNVGTYVNVTSKPHEAAHGLQSRYAVLKLSLDLLDPSAGKLTVGATTTGFAAQVQKAQANAIKTVEANVAASQSKAILELEQRTSSNISQSSAQIMSRVADEYYTKGDTDQKISSVSTQVTQNAEQVEIKFNQFQQDASDVQAGNDAKFTDISKYIRFADGNIILGEDGNQLTLKIENDRISFRGANDLELAHFSNNSFEITNLSKFRVGSLAMVVQPNGSVSFVGA